MTHSQSNDANASVSDISFWTLTTPLASRWRRVVITPLLLGMLAVGISYLIKPEFNAKATFLPPQQQQSAAASALSQISALSGLTGGAGAKNSADQYVALMQSTTVAQRMVDRFKLIDVYESKSPGDAREELSKRARFGAGKKDGLISVEVLDTDPARAADMANAFIDELRKLSGSLALTEAQQRRVFFEGQVKATREKLEAAQAALQQSGFQESALRAEPKAAAESFAKLNAELIGAEVRLQAMRSSLADNTPEVQAQSAVVGGLRKRLERVESSSSTGSPDANYIGKYREFKYQEALFEVFSRQFELARVDEAKEGALIQVVDSATPPERKVSPRRGIIGLVTTVLSGLLLVLGSIAVQMWRLTGAQPQVAGDRTRWLASFKRA